MGIAPAYDVTSIPELGIELEIPNTANPVPFAAKTNGYKSIESFKNWKSTVPSYYHVARGSVFKDVLKFDNSFIEEMKKFNSLDYSDEINGYSTHIFVEEAKLENGGKWCLDEMYSSDLILKYKDPNSVKLLSMPDVPSRDDLFYHFHKPYPSSEQIANYIGV